jgi:hypothetical protein
MGKNSGQILGEVFVLIHKLHRFGDSRKKPTENTVPVPFVVRYVMIAQGYLGFNQIWEKLGLCPFIITHLTQFS